MRLDNILSYLSLSTFNKVFFFKLQMRRFIYYLKVFKDIEIYIKKFALSSVVKIMKQQTLLQFKYLVDINAVDFIKIDNFRFRLTYTLKSIYHLEVVHLIFFLNELDSIFSLSKIFLSAGWLEREI